MQTRRLIGLGGTILVATLTVAAADRPTPPAAASTPLLRGVSLSGAEFGTDRPDFSNANPGRCGHDYAYPTEPTVRYFCTNGLKLLRLPVRWERLQPTPGGPIDSLELARVRLVVGWARKYGGEVIIDLHNYGRYALADGRGGRRLVVIDQQVAGRAPVSRADFADFWRRMAEAFRDEPAVHAFGLMNEPHDMGRSDWKAISQAAVDAIRATGDRHRILVAGLNWSKAAGFARANGPRAWIADPAGNVAYEAHVYLDSDGSGRYERAFEVEAEADSALTDRGAARLAEFAAWCRANHVAGFIGELGVPRDSRWNPALQRLLAAAEAEGMATCAWGGGEWWGGYPLSIQPSPDGRSDAPAMEVLRATGR